MRSVAWVLALVLLITSFGCVNEEQRAQGMYRNAMDRVRDGELDEAIEIMEEIVRRYPDTPAGRNARKDVVLYRGLAGAEERFPMMKARDLMVQTARSIERYRGRHRRVPASLSALSSGGAGGDVLDPWGRPLAYRTARGGRSYVLECFGADGAPGGGGLDGDFVVRDGTFVEEPEETRP